MNYEGLYQLLSNTFDEVMQIDEKVYRTTKKYNNVPFAIYYFDFSESINSSDFDINTYQERFISRDYYTHPGYLQWNFYLVYICSPENIHKINKIEIEKNKIYTRKHIVTPQELTTLPPFLKMSGSPAAGVSPNDDLGSNWIQKLKEAQLDVVFLTEETYAEGLRRYLDGNPILQEEDNIFEEPVTEETEANSFISKIILDEYRPYPKQKEFKLGAFNLINGVNGCGKTSFLEAIELFYCGKTLKEKDSIQSGRMRFFFGDKELQYEPSNNKAFRLKDRKWYNKIYSQGNRLCESFGKYNFFDSDAGYRLSKSDNQVEIKTAFIDIALGENINELEKRIKGFFDRFQAEESKYGNEIERLEKSIKEELKTIEELSFIPNEHEKIFDLIQDEALRIQWIGPIPTDIHEDTSIFVKALLSVQNTLKTVDTDLDWLSNISLDITQKESNTLKNKLSRLEAFNTKKKALEKQQKDLDKMIFDLKELEDLLNKCEKYFSEPQLLSLIGLNDRIDGESQYLSRLYSAKELLKQIDLQPFKSVEKKIEDYRGEQNQRKTSWEKRKVELNMKVSQIVQSLDEFEQLVTDIKSLGKRFIFSAEKVESCPLCNSKFEKEELIKRIETYQTNLDDSLLNSFQGEILDLDKNLAELDKLLNNLSKLEVVCGSVFERDILNNELSLKSLISEMEKIYELINDSETRIEQLRSLKEHFVNKGLSEDEAKTLKKAIENRIDGLKLV